MKRSDGFSAVLVWPRCGLNPDTQAANPDSSTGGGFRTKEFAEPGTLSSSAPANFPLPRTAYRSGFGLLAPRARRKRDTTARRVSTQVGAGGFLAKSEVYFSAPSELDFPPTARAPRDGDRVAEAVRAARCAGRRARCRARRARSSRPGAAAPAGSPRRPRRSGRRARSRSAPVISPSKAASQPSSNSAPLEQPGEADRVGRVLDLGRLPLARGAPLGELGQVVRRPASSEARARASSARWQTRSG